MDIRTYPDELARLRSENERLTHELGQCASENNQLAENAAELGKALDVCIAERDQAYRDLDAQTLKANSFRRELHRYMQHAIELKDMLDASVAERDSAFAELDKHRRELTALREERPRLLAANVRLFHDNNKLRRMSSLWKRTAKHYKRLRINDDRFRLLAESTFAKENEQLRAELDAERNAHNATAAQLYAELAGAQDTATAAVQAWRTMTAERDALRAELDAMRQAHSVVAARMAAMGC